ncbi:response regulator transcription factor [Flavobacterium amniphilum]|uniref:LytR/AlgR family response regulator transcription factor n=1 Tax=Flavobacterium amniphilum TaxID=1834035 RepID=UPI00202A12D4|nr:response regulator transcription factor [Flavobacterium amniphilum]MCL9805451.1 response regulator transcription factor [Flavobacterium amniphilum]
MSTKIKCLLLDDELPGLTYLKMLCEQIKDLEVVKAFNSPVSFLNELEHHEFDLCIIDIEMPGMNGLQVANLLHGKPVIFTTAYKEYAAEAYDIDAVDYVRKPIKMERLQQAITKAKIRLSAHKNEKDFVQLNTDKGKALIFFDQLCYIKVSEIDSRDKIIRLQDSTEITLKNISFDKLLEILPGNSFVRINKKEIIALKIIKVFSFDEITTNIQLPSGGSLKLILSETYRNEFLQKVQY